MPLSRSLRARRAFPLLLALAAASLLAPAGAQEVAFRFRPPNGLSFVQTSRTTRVKEMGGQKQTDATVTRTKLTYRKTPKGWSLQAVPVSVTFLRDGRKVDNPLMKAISEMRVTYELDSAGRLLSISGLDRALTRLRNSLPPEMAGAVASVLTPAAVFAREKAEWQGRVESLAGRRAKVGDVWTGEDTFEVPTGGSASYRSATQIVRFEPVGKTRCVRIRTLYNTDASALSKQISRMAGKAAKAAGAPPGKVPSVSGLQVEGSAERVVDPATMLVHSETYSRTMRMQMRSPSGSAAPAVMRERREYRYTYPKAGSAAPKTAAPKRRR